VSSHLQAALAFAAACLVASAAAGQDSVEAFYRGRTVTITAGSAVGGGYDSYARWSGVISEGTFPETRR
jgi:tripartite-type tricarboxylate transporter receptor subunit TctC